LIQKKSDLRLLGLRSWNNWPSFSGQKHTVPLCLLDPALPMVNGPALGRQNLCQAF